VTVVRQYLQVGKHNNIRSMTAQKGIDVSSKKGQSVILIYVRNVSIMGWERGLFQHQESKMSDREFSIDLLSKAAAKRVLG
jgi:hypothetical protein